MGASLGALWRAAIGGRSSRDEERIRAREEDEEMDDESSGDSDESPSKRQRLESEEQGQDDDDDDEPSGASGRGGRAEGEPQLHRVFSEAFPGEHEETLAPRPIQEFTRRHLTPGAGDTFTVPIAVQGPSTSEQYGATAAVYQRPRQSRPPAQGRRKKGGHAHSTHLLFDDLRAGAKLGQFPRQVVLASRLANSVNKQGVWLVGDREPEAHIPVPLGSPVVMEGVSFEWIEQL